jgi:hypothetical protein
MADSSLHSVSLKFCVSLSISISNHRPAVESQLGKVDVISAARKGPLRVVMNELRLHSPFQGKTSEGSK